MESRATAKPRVVVVTGSSAGIGRAAARAFGQHGADVALLARGEDGIHAGRREVEAMGRRALAIDVDVANADQVEAAAERIERELGPIDVWVNNAMATIFSPFIDITPEEYRRATEVTHLGTVYGTLAALKRMRARNHGTIVQVGSALAYRSIPLQAPYCGAKFAIRGFTESLRCELLHERSRVKLTMVQLSAFNTPQFDWARAHLPRRPQPVPPIFQPEIAADAIVWAARHPRREHWVGFPAVRTILAQHIAPGLLDRLAARMTWEGQMSDEALPPNRPDNCTSRCRAIAARMAASTLRRAPEAGNGGRRSGGARYSWAPARCSSARSAYCSAARHPRRGRSCRGLVLTSVKPSSPHGPKKQESHRPRGNSN